MQRFRFGLTSLARSISIVCTLAFACICLGQVGTSTSGPAASGPATQKVPATMAASQPTVTALRLRGYAVLPEPRKVDLAVGTVPVSAGWKVQADGLGEADQTLHVLQVALAGLPAPTAETSAGVIHLAIRAGSVACPDKDDIPQQAYQITITPGRVEVVGNAAPGLFYGAQTLAQLLQGNDCMAGVLPEGVISDWPAYSLRIVHWDTKHHQDRMDTLKRYFDQLASFKINAVVFEIEDKFAYPTNPIIGAPGAFTPAQFQELTDYALARHIQLIPNVQAPAHMTYVLKHPEFAALRCDGSNYMACMDDPAARKLIFQMYDDLVAANRGVKYFFVSTDEVYYAGICERYRKPYNPVNRSLTWVDFVNAARDHLAGQGRQIIVWAEFPLLDEHVKGLPDDIIDGIAAGSFHIAQENARGIRQLAYVNMQGEEKFFPTYLPGPDASGKTVRGHLAEAYETTLRGQAVTEGDPLGTFSAAWDDAGLHDETFWLGWAAMAQGAWNPGSDSTAQITAEFMDIFYGRSVEGMYDVYRLLQDQSRFYESTWTGRPSKVRPPGYGFSAAKRPVTRTDWTLLPPPLPDAAALEYAPTFAKRYEKTLAQLPEKIAANDRLQFLLQANLGRAIHNQYNLEVLLSLARLERHHLEMLGTLAAAEGLLTQAQAAEKAGEPAKAIGLMVQAHGLITATINDMYERFGALQATWEKSRLPKNATVDGKVFLHVGDDVKDHFADRRADLSYLIAPEESIGLAKWASGLDEVIQAYAKAKGVPVNALPVPILDF